MAQNNIPVTKGSQQHVIDLFAVMYRPLSGQAWVLFLLLALTFITPIFAASFGAADISFTNVFRILVSAFYDANVATDNISQRIVVDLRMPRIILAFVAGAGLAISGSVLQTVTRNPLADPFLFGISSGASLGAVCALALFSSEAAWLSVPVGAFCGASLSSIIVLGLAGTGVTSQTERMLLSGVAISFMFGAITSLVLYFSSPQAAASVLFWSLGSFAKASWSGLLLPSIVVGVGIVIVLGLKRQIMTMLAGDETAHTLGISVAKLRLWMLLLCSLMTAILVAHCGGIGFVGLMVPHTVRLLFPGRYPIMITALVGGLFMVWVDVLARSWMSNQELPVGIITSVIGSVFFLLVLRRRRR